MPFRYWGIFVLSIIPDGIMYYLNSGQYLEEYVYEKIWSELSKGDKELLVAMAKTNDTKVEAIRKTIKKASNSFSVYRNRLIKKGLIISPEYGHLEFTLPRFKEFVLCR